jgi:hypothetical protein
LRGFTLEAKLNLSHVREKLAEVHFFLAKMIEREQQLIGESFNSYLNAFLMAAMAVRDPFGSKAVKDWRENWEKSLIKHASTTPCAKRERTKPISPESCGRQSLAGAPNRALNCV